MRVSEKIYNRLVDVFSPSQCEVINESPMHNVPPGTEKHFKVIIVSNEFNGLSLIKRHRLVYKALEEAFQEGLHALAIHAFTPKEYKEQSVHDSPACRGGLAKAQAREGDDA